MISTINSGQLCEIDPGPVRELASSVEKFFILSAAVELEIFDMLKEPKNAAKLSKEANLHSGLTEKLCDALVASDFLIKEGNTYSVSDISKTLLVKDSPFYQGNLIKLLKNTREGRWNKLSEAIKEGPLGMQPEAGVFDKSFILAMAEAAICGSLQRTIEVVRNNPDFLEAKRALDLGGGHGLYSIAFSQLNPELEVSVFDLPKVIDEVTEEIISDFEGKIKTITGDFVEDDIGSDYDLIFASDVLYRPEKSLKSLLEKINSSLKDDGIVISKHYHIDDLIIDSTAVFFDLMFSINELADRVYSSSQFCDMLDDCGFSVVQVENISDSFSPSRIIIARKVKR